jgi:hypothetical protein
MRVLNEQVIVDGDMSASISGTVNVTHMGQGTVYCKWTGAGAAGTIGLQASVNGSDYVALASADTVSGAGSKMYHIADVGYNYLQIVFTKTGGSTGTLNAWANAKGF